MDILFIIYIFALFVIFSPNFIFHYSKSNNIMVAIIHALLFSVVVYVTYRSVINKQTEGATIGTFEKNDVSVPLNVNEMNLGNVMNDSTDQSEKKDVIFNNDIVVSSPTSVEEDKLIAMPPYDYSNFRSYDYDNMQKKLKMLESHKHTNHYFDLVPNFNQTRHEILCAADYGTSKPCCRQPNAYIPESNQCDALKPYCMDYIAGKQWGKCVSENPYPKPNLVYDGVINTPTAPSPAPPVVVKKSSGDEVPVDTETKPDGTVVVNCPVLQVKSAPAPAPDPAPVISNTYNINVNSSPWKQPMISSIEIYQQPTNYPNSTLTKEGDTVVYTYSPNMVKSKTSDMFILKNNSNDELTQYNVNIVS